MSGALRMMTAGARRFNPLDISGLSAWFDGGDAGTFTFSAGAAVSQWRDKSANGYHLGVDGTAPQRDSTVNGRSAVRFAGNGRLVRSNAPINNSSDGAWTVFAVARPDTVSATMSIVDGDLNLSASTRIGQYIRTESMTPQTIGFQPDGIPVFDAGPSVAQGVVYRFRSRNTGTALEMFVNGSTNGAVATTGQQWSAAAPLTIGAFSANLSQPFTGLVCEVVCYGRALEAAEMADVEQYLSSKWGV